MNKNSTTAPFARATMEPGNIEVFRDGFGSNADLYIYKLNGTSWFVKDFYKRSWLVRNTLGRFYTARESKALYALHGMDGIPPYAFQIDEYAISYQFVPGRNMRKIYKDANKPGKGFFDQLEQLVNRMHERGIIHLDIRNGENIIATDDEHPMLLDFQSSINIKNIPVFLHNFLKQIDCSGIYKHWSRIDPSSMSKEKKEILEKINGTRRLWFYRNPVLRSVNKLFNNPAIRKTLLKLRAPLTILFLVLLINNMNPAYFWAGLAISAIGEMLQVWCFASLKKQKILAANGPYAVVRNPMYLGRYFMILGGVVLSGNVWIIAVFSIIYYFYMENRVKREEELLIGIFGESYSAYCNTTRRFIPTFRKANLKPLFFFKQELFLRNHAQWNILGWAAAWVVLYCFALKVF